MSHASRARRTALALAIAAAALASLLASVPLAPLEGRALEPIEGAAPAAAPSTPQLVDPESDPFRDAATPDADVAADGAPFVDASDARAPRGSLEAHSTDGALPRGDAPGRAGSSTRGSETNDTATGDASLPPGAAPGSPEAAPAPPAPGTPPTEPPTSEPPATEPPASGTPEGGAPESPPGAAPPADDAPAQDAPVTSPTPEDGSGWSLLGWLLHTASRVLADV